MGDHPPLSLYLLTEGEVVLRSFVEDSPEDERADRQEWTALVKTLTERLIRSREELASDDMLKLEQKLSNHRQLVEGWLDDHFSIQQLKEVSDLVWRTLQLASLTAKSPASQQTNRYISEAARAYVKGLPLASIAMSRAALEQGLRERLGYQQTDERPTFDRLVEEAGKYKLLHTYRAGAPIRELAKRCNEVLHRQPTSDEEAIEILGGIRSLLEEIYSADGC